MGGRKARAQARTLLKQRGHCGQPRAVKLAALEQGGAAKLPGKLQSSGSGFGRLFVHFRFCFLQFGFCFLQLRFCNGEVSFCDFKIGLGDGNLSFF